MQTAPNHNQFKKTDFFNVNKICPMSNLKNFIWICLFIMGIPVIGTAKSNSVKCISSYRDRGLEVRYIKMEIREKQELPKEIKVGGINYPLYKTKEEAYNSVQNAGIKRDITVVYVVSAIEKETEMLSLSK